MYFWWYRVWSRMVVLIIKQSCIVSLTNSQNFLLICTQINLLWFVPDVFEIPWYFVILCSVLSTYRHMYICEKDFHTWDRHFRNSIYDHSIHQYCHHAGYSDTFNRVRYEEPGTNSDFSFRDVLVEYLLTPFNNRYLVWT